MHEIVLGLFRGEISYFFVHIPIFSSLCLPMVCANSHKLRVMQFWLPPQGFLLENLSEIKLQAGLHQLVRRACSFSSNITILFSTLLSPTAKFFPSYQLDSPSPTAIQTFGNSCLSLHVLISRPLPLLFKLICFLHSGALGKVAVLACLPLPQKKHYRIWNGIHALLNSWSRASHTFCSVFKTHVGRRFSCFSLLIPAHLLSVPEAKMERRYFNLILAKLWSLFFYNSNAEGRQSGKRQKFHDWHFSLQTACISSQNLITVILQQEEHDLIWIYAYIQRLRTHS